MLLTNKNDKIITLSKNHVLNNNKTIFRVQRGHSPRTHISF